MAGVENLSTEAIDAWVLDTEEREQEESEIYQPTIQAEVIPLACVWCLAKAQFDRELVTPFQFAKEMMAHDGGRETWRRRAEKTGDPAIDIDRLDYTRLIKEYRSSDIIPLRFTLTALEGGRNEPTLFITGVEFSLLSALGHAAYNSDVTQMIWLEPFGPPAPPHMDAYSWYNQAGDHVRQFAQDSLNLKIDR